jgi:hypothetical protein
MTITKITSKAVEADAKYPIDVDTVDGKHDTDFLHALTAQSELTIATGVITITTPGYIPVDTQSDASTDDLDTISGGTNGDVILLYPAHTNRTVVVKHNTGNIHLLAERDIALIVTDEILTLRYNGTDWQQIAGPRVAVFGYNLGNLGAGALPSGAYGDIPIIPACYILGIYGMADASGSINGIDIRTETFGTIPDSADSIGTSPVFVMSSQQTKSDTTLSGVTREQNEQCWRFIATAGATTIEQLSVVVLAVVL